VKEFVHYGATYASVSPCERYMYTYTAKPQKGQGKYAFWNIE